MSMRLYDEYKYMKKCGLSIVGIKTDAILTAHEVTCQKYFNFEDKIGGYKFETDKKCVDKKIEQEQNDLITFRDVIVNDIQIKDEYDSEELAQHFDAYPTMLMKGVYFSFL